MRRLMISIVWVCSFVRFIFRKFIYISKDLTTDFFLAYWKIRLFELILFNKLYSRLVGTLTKGLKNSFDSMIAWPNLHYNVLNVLLKNIYVPVFRHFVVCFTFCLSILHCTFFNEKKKINLYFRYESNQRNYSGIDKAKAAC